jgi:hypothetical protein
VRITTCDRSAGVALLAVLFALTLLMLLALPFAVSMSVGADAAVREVEETSVVQAAASARELLLAHRDRLREEFEAFRPTATRYSPLSFFFNFSHNVLKGAVVDGLLRGTPWPVALTDLFTSYPHDPDVSANTVGLAETLMGYARANPQKIRGRFMPVIVYDPSTGRESFGNTIRKFME